LVRQENPMAVVTSISEQQRVADAARKVGGYEQLVRLAREKQAAGANAKLVKDNDTGQWTYKAA
jgi:hypothetical protein